MVRAVFQSGTSGNEFLTKVFDQSTARSPALESPLRLSVARMKWSACTLFPDPLASLPSWFGLQSVDPAGAACKSLEGAVCGGAGNGSISSVTGNVALAQAGKILRATSGASVSPGVRILAGQGGAAQVNLGAGCFTSVAPNSVATFTSRSGLTCLRQSETFAAQAGINPYDNNGLLAAGRGCLSRRRSWPGCCRGQREQQPQPLRDREP
jgi:hypothetical protein